MRVLGIDEAGRGCVFGPLVLGAFLVEDDREALLWEAGARDSKKLSARRREVVREAVRPLGVEAIRTIRPHAIDRGNLNALEERAILSLVGEFLPDRVVIDALGHPSTLDATRARLARELPPSIEWVIEPKADANHAVVAAASIVAKTTRDAHLETLKETWGTLGSGYPSDPKTRGWLTSWAKTGAPWPDFVRTRWKTVEILSQQALEAC